MFRKLTSHLNSYTFSLWNKEGNKAFKIKKEGCPNLWCWSQKQEESGARKPEHKSWRIEEEKNQTILKAQTKRRSKRKKREKKKNALIYSTDYWSRETKQRQEKEKGRRREKGGGSIPPCHSIQSHHLHLIKSEEKNDEKKNMNMIDVKRRKASIHHPATIMIDHAKKILING